MKLANKLCQVIPNMPGDPAAVRRPLPGRFGGLLLRAEILAGIEWIWVDLRGYLRIFLHKTPIKMLVGVKMYSKQALRRAWRTKILQLFQNETLVCYSAYLDEISSKVS